MPAGTAWQVGDIGYREAELAVPSGLTACGSELPQRQDPFVDCAGRVLQAGEDVFEDARGGRPFTAGRKSTTIPSSSSVSRDRDRGSFVPLDEVLRIDPQIVEFHSDHMFAPWWMLYTPPEQKDDSLSSDPPCDPSGFWGFRHLIQHTVRRHPGWSPEIVAPVGGLNVNAVQLRNA